MVGSLLLWLFLFILFIWIINVQDDLRQVKEQLSKYKQLVNQYVAKNLTEQKFGTQTQEDSRPESITEIAPEPVIKYEVPERRIPEPSISPKIEIKEQEEIQPIDLVPEKQGFENVFLGNIFNKIGAIALILGIGFFVKVVSEFVEITPLMRIIAAFIAGITMMGISLKLHKDEMKNYAEVLMGTGFAVLFITVYCASSLYHLMPVSAATAYGIILVLLTWFISEKYKTFSTFAIGFLGGYLNPFFINSDITVNYLLGYLVFLNVISVIYTQRNPNKVALNYVNLFLTTLTGLTYSVMNYEQFNYLYIVALWAVYIINDIVNITRNRYNEVKNPYQILGFMNYIMLWAFIKAIDSMKHTPEVSMFLFGSALVYLLCANYLKDKNAETVKPYVYGAIVSFFAASYFMLTGTPRILLWAIGGAVLAFTASRYKYLANWTLLFALSAFSGIFFVKNAVYLSDIQSYVPIWNFRLALFGVPALCALFSSFALKENEKVSQIYKFLALSLAYLFITFETSFICQKYSANWQSADFVHVYSLCIIGFIYSMNMKRLAAGALPKLFSAASGGIFIITTLTMLFASGISTDSHVMPIINIRFIAYLFAIFTSIYYYRTNKNNAYMYLALIFGFICAHCEASAFTDGNPLAISVTWILYSGAITLIGIYRKLDPLKRAGIWVSILAVLKIVLFDIISMEPAYKVIVLMTLGFILMIVSFIYTKLKSED